MKLEDAFLSCEPFGRQAIRTLDATSTSTYHRGIIETPKSVFREMRRGRLLRLSAAARDSFITYNYERVCRLMVIRGLVASKVLGSTPHRSEYSGI